MTGFGYATARITLEEALQPETVAAYVRKSTGAKYLLTPRGKADQRTRG